MKFELQCSRSFNGISLDPEPDWSLDDLVSELKALELKQGKSSWVTSPPRRPACRQDSRGCFIMRAPEDEAEEVDTDGVFVMQGWTRRGTRFSCKELDASESDSSEDESFGMLKKSVTCLMEKACLPESILYQARHENQLKTQDEIRRRLAALEADFTAESERSAAALIQVNEYMCATKEADMKHDKQYRRRIAEELDHHLSAVQRDHEQLSLIEERRLRVDQAFEEAKRKEKLVHEEKMRQAKANAELAMQSRIRAAKAAEEEEAKRKAAEEAERRANEEAKATALEVGKKMDKTAADRESGVIRSTVDKNEESKSEVSASVIKSTLTENISLRPLDDESSIKASKHALRLEEQRLGLYTKFMQLNSRYDSEAKKGFVRRITKRVNQISGTEEHFSVFGNDLVNIFRDSRCPQSLTMTVFAKQILCRCETSMMSHPSFAFACARVVVFVTSKFPVAMDLILAEFNKACIYTIPKHIIYSKSKFPSREAYLKMMGYQEEDGTIETRAKYLERLDACMTLYAAIVQTEMPNTKNIHGLREGWTWIACFLNTIPAGPSSAVALLAFLKMAGFALYRKYKAQFKKVMDVIHREFLPMLKAQNNPELSQVILSLETYIECKLFLQEPKGRQLQRNTLS